MLKYSPQKPTTPGWYWCRNFTEQPGKTWEAVVYVYQSGIHGDAEGDEPELVCSWMTAPGECGTMRESEWSNLTQWAGPLQTPGLVTAPVAT